MVIKLCIKLSASIEVVPESFLITNCVQIHKLDVNTCTIRDTEFESNFVLKAESSGNLTSIAGYFDTFFDDPSLDNQGSTFPNFFCCI